jgi:integrase
VAEFVRTWLEGSRSQLAPQTYSYRKDVVLKLYIEPEIGKIPVNALTVSQMQNLFNHMTARRLSPQTVAHTRNLLRRALRTAVEAGMLPRNVAALARPPKMVRKPITPLTPEQAKAFLAAVRPDPNAEEQDRREGDRLEALYALALTTGLRRGELLALNWEDVDLARAELRVRGSLHWVDGKAVVQEPKTAMSRRAVSLTRLAIEALNRQRERQAKARQLAGGRWQASGYVFTNTLGGPLEGSNLVRSFKAALRRTGLPEIRFHDLRHSAATMCLMQGVPARVVMEMLGHSQITLTLNTYSHVLPALQREAAERLDSLLTP